ncbi:MAG TPA: hypothetical protein VFZ75_02775 [Actinomycetota bacterium]|nr:hypothetical protein [Actinomycetota bacterium]
MRLRRVVVLCSLAAALAPVQATAGSFRQETPAEPEDQIVLAGTVTVRRGTRVGEVVVFSGRVRVDGVVTGDVVVLEGPVIVRGQVDGSVIAADGDVRLGATALVGGDVSAGGAVLARPGAEVGGERAEGVRFSLEGPLAALGELLGPAAIAISVLFAGLLLLLLAPRSPPSGGACSSRSPSRSRRSRSPSPCSVCPSAWRCSCRPACGGSSGSRPPPGVSVGRSCATRPEVSRCSPGGPWSPPSAWCRC